MGVIPAAGTVPWRRRRGQLQVALVHRPKYDDWAWAKGKLDPGEDWAVAAVRETHEETALEVRLGRPLPCAAYTVLDRDGEPATKEVRYWAAEVVGGDGRLVNEVDEVRWLEVAAAHDLLDYARDRDQLRALVRADAAGALATWPLALVRHAKAFPRSQWKDPDDQLRPLDRQGRWRAEAIAPLLAAYGQRVDKRKKPSATGPYQHPLRVYLIDDRQQIRNIYSFGLLDPRLVITDVQTLLAERSGATGDPR